MVFGNVKSVTYCNAARVNAVHGLGLGIPKTNVQLTSMLHQRLTWYLLFEFCCAKCNQWLVFTEINRRGC